MDSVYFIGIGGIGMSALARWFLKEGKHVGGYDRTETPLTRQLAEEGASIHYVDDAGMIGERFRDPAKSVVVYTPAVPADHSELRWFRDNGFEVLKRSEVLGVLAEGRYVMAVAGTHGKTTTTTMVAWLNHIAGGGGSAFLGGISKNFGSNLVAGPGDRFAVEADEFDRSFLRLHPDVALITSADPDHLDIYGTHGSLLEAFAQFADQIREGGSLIMHTGAEIPTANNGISTYRYSFGSGDFHAGNISIGDDGTYRFDIVCPDRTIVGCRLGIPGRINVENAIGAVGLMWAAAHQRGEALDEEGIRKALDTFSGVRRRFDFHINTTSLIYMDDYAHHPEELRAAIGSVREMFPGRRITAIFQPHLYSRTRDFYTGFAEALSLADDVVLLPIYPARELPIEGVSSEMIADRLTVPYRIVPLADIASEIARIPGLYIVIWCGGADSDTKCGDIALDLGSDGGQNHNNPTKTGKE